MYKIIDLFSGCGGLTTGFHLAGFESICAIDLNSKSLETYKHNYPNTRIINKNIQEVSPLELRKQLRLEQEELTALIGGPPCQGLSKNTPASQRYLEDPRNKLYLEFLDFVDEFKPQYVVLENVPEILTAYGGVICQEITERLTRLGYEVKFTSLNAANFGVPQMRKRAFFLASLIGSPTIPQSTHTVIKNNNISFDGDATQLPLLHREAVTVRAAISDLPPLLAGQAYSDEGYSSSPHCEYQCLMRSGSSKILNHVARKLSPVQMARVQCLEEGEDARSLPSSLAPKKHYSGAYGRLYWDQPCKTITRWMFHPGSGRFFHPIQDRTITIREAARLHSYPDTFEFLGTYTSMSSQIGESVPPLLAKAIACNLLKDFHNQSNS